MKAFTTLLLLTISSSAFCQAPANTSKNSVWDVEISSPTTPKSVSTSYNNYNRNSSVRQTNTKLIAEADEHIRAENEHKRRVDLILADAVNTLKPPTIQYSLPSSSAPGKEHFYEALKEFIYMLKQEKPLSLLNAVYLVEHSFDPSLSFEFFEKNIQDAANHVLTKLQQDGYESTDNVAKNMMLFRYMVDTLEIDYPGLEAPVISYPKTYDFDDFWGQHDYSKLFVSKLLGDGSGQCHSLPLLYLLIAEQIDAQAHLAFAPNHSYIKFKDENEVWHSLELTVGAVTSESFIIESGFVKSEAIKNRVYLEPIGKRQLIAHSVNDLLMAYTRKFGYDDDRFINTAAGLVYEVFPNNITTHQILANYYKTRLDYVTAQYRYHGLTKEDFEEDEEANHLLTQVIGANKHIEKLGYAPMPEQMYADWLESVRNKANEQYSQVAMEQLQNQIRN